MPKSTDIKIVEAKFSTEEVPFRTPLKFGGRVMDSSVLLNVEVIVETRNGKQGIGIGSMPAGNIWAWPSAVVSPEESLKAMIEFLEEAVEIANICPEVAHPIDLMYHISAEYHFMAKKLSKRLGLAEEIPELAQLVASSPLDAAIHDGFGRANHINSYNGLSAEYMSHDLTEYLDDQFKGEYLDQYTLRDPKPTLPLYHLVGALDPITEADITERVDDGLPETLGEWIKADGLTHLKIKLSGDNMDWDISRVIAVENEAVKAQGERGQDKWVYSLDFNEKCENVDYVLDFLNKIREQTPAAFDRVQYIEQPTNRDLKANPENKMHEAAKIKPVVIDESLVDYESLLLSRDLGYSGVALKACKGQTESLFLGAAAQKFDMFFCVQDLTCCGYSFLHSASLAARIPSIAAIEGNGRQYCPGPNKKWKRSYPGMFNITDGTVKTAELNGDGLGF